MSEIEKLNAAKAESKRLDAARMALPDDASDEVLAIANAAYFAALEKEGECYAAWNRASATPERRAAMDEQAEIQRRQSAASDRLLARDAIAPGIRPTQSQLDAADDDGRNYPS